MKKSYSRTNDFEAAQICSDSHIHRPFVFSFHCLLYCCVWNVLIYGLSALFGTVLMVSVSMVCSEGFLL